MTDLLKRTHVYNTQPPVPDNTPKLLNGLNKLIEQTAHIIKTLKSKQYKQQKKIISDLNNQLVDFNQGIDFIFQKSLISSLNKYDDKVYENTQINAVFLESMCSYIHEHFIDRKLKLLKENNATNLNEKQLGKFIAKYETDFKILLNNMKLFVKFQVWNKLQLDHNDIIAKPIKFWSHLDTKIDYRLIFEDINIMHKQMHSFLHMISITNAVCYRTNELEVGLQKSIYEVMYTVLFKLFRNKSFQTTHQFFAEDDIQTGVKVAIGTWNGLDNVNTMRYWMQSTLPFINYHKKFYLHKSFEEITIDKCINWMQKDNLTEQEQLKRKENINNRNIYQKTNKTDKVKIRILSNTPLSEKQNDLSQNNQFFNFLNKFNIFTKKPQADQELDTVILHIHGGGWVSMSSFTHQMYTRRWAKNNELQNVPIISVDYRKAPECAYPCAIEDCWQTYLFIVNEINKYFNINPKKIIIAGDSAGGNMALAICQLCIKYNVQMPAGLMLSYPAVSIADNSYTPSINKAMTDLIAPFAFLDLCINMYMQDKRCDPIKDSLLSPLFMKPENLKKLPPIRMTCGEEDCLKDDAIRFLDKLVKSGHNNSNLLIYKGLKHGYLNWDMPLAMPITRQCSTDAAQMMKQMINESDKK